MANATAAAGMDILFAALSGACFALIPVSLRAAAGRGIEPRHMLLAAMPLCLVVFLPGALRGDAPTAVWLAGLGVGAGQFGAILCLRWGLRHGPTAPLWCAAMLGFVLAVLWDWWRWDAVPTPGRSIAVLAALTAVVAAAGDARGGDSGGSSGGGGRRRLLLYALALAAVWLLNGVTNTVFKDLAMRPAADGGDLMQAHGDLVLVLMYAVMGIGALADLAVRPARAPLKATLACGVAMAAGSTGGISLLRLCLHAPAAMIFTVNTSASLLIAVACTWAFWGERPMRAGWISLAFALVAVAAAAL